MNIKQRRLPSAYQEVEWIGTTAEGGQYFQSNIVPTENMGFKMKYYQESNQSSNAIINSYNVGDTGQWGLRQRNGYWQCIRASSHVYISTRTFPAIVNVEFNCNNDGKCRITQDGNTDETTLPTYSTNNVPLAIFAQTNGSAVNWKCVGGRIYSLEFIDYTSGSSIVANLIPCYRISDSEIGMYDTVGGTFYTNQGTGSFTKGADVVTVDSITIPQTGRRIPSAYQECEWIGFDGASCLALNNTFSLNDLTVKGKFISTGTGERCLVGMGSASTTYFEVFTQSSNNTVRIWDTSSNVGVPSTIGTLTDFTATWDNGTKTITSNGQTASGSSLTGNLIVKIGTHREGAYWFIGQVHSLSFESTNSSAILVPCYRISDSVIGMYDIINDVFYTNQGSGTFTKGNDVVLTDNNVAVIKQGNQRIWQRLPWEYQEVEWIGGNYDGQTILPVHTSDTSIQSMTFEADVFFDSSGSGERALGFGTSGLVECYIATDSRFCYWVSGAGRLASVASVTNEFVHFKLEDKPSGGQFIFGNTTVNFNSALSSLSNYKGVQIFGYSTSSYLVKAKMKEARLTIDGQSYHLVPCYRKSDNVVGMYDLVSGNFHTNRLTGNFIKGNDL